MKLYHGSNLIVTEPKLVAQARALDFGAGFYTTANKEQAVEFSGKVVKRAKVGAAGVRSVSVYEFDEAAAGKELKILRFGQPDKAWLDFVSQNRKAAYSGVQYDLVVGAVANDDVFPTLVIYEQGILSCEDCLNALKIKKLFDQYVFKTEKALRYLRFTGKILPEGDGNGR